MPKSRSGLSLHFVKIEDLPQKWYEYSRYTHCQQIGDKWSDESESAVLRVPSAIIKKEYNYLINPNHEFFRNIGIIRIEEFEFDPRIKE